MKGDIFLSPSCRLLADTPGPAHRVLDGRGHRLVLPTAVDAQERLPLIVVGAGKTLQLRNITIVHSTSLAACLHLGAGASRTCVGAYNVWHRSRWLSYLEVSFGACACTLIITCTTHLA